MQKMEPDNTADDAASMDMDSKKAMFECYSKPQQYSQTSKQTVRRPSVKKKVLTAYQSSTAGISREGNERVTSPQRISQGTLEERSPGDERWLRFSQELRANIRDVSIRKSSGWSLKDMPVFQKPLCLVSTDEHNTLTIETETLEQIQKIDWQMVIVSVVGLYRTGKSYLMNCLAESTAEGFPLGSSVESTTKGIWAWCKIHPKLSNTVLLLLDTEGLGDVDKGDPDHDHKIFLLATLLSNCFVYNMKGVLDQDVLDKLTFVTEIAKNIRFRGKLAEDNEYINLILPDFVLCLRDFTLQLSKGGKKITRDQYLEQCLAEKKGKGDKFNWPRKCIRKHFPVRKCFTLPVPGDTAILDKIKFNKLPRKFREKMDLFKSYVYSRKPKELITSKPVNGNMFATLITYYVDAIKHGAVPDVDNAFSSVAKVENTRIKQETVGIFKTQMQKVDLPVSRVQLEKYYTEAQLVALGYLRDQVVNDTDGQYEREALMEMDNFWDTLKDNNQKHIREMCDVRLQEIYSKSLEGKIFNRVYEVAGGYRQFQRDIEILKEEYFRTLRDFDEDEILTSWYGFVIKLTKTESEILNSDEALSQEEKEDEEKRNKTDFEKIFKDQQYAHQRALEEQRKVKEKHQKEILDASMKQMKENHEKYMEFIEERLSKVETELERARLEELERRARGFFSRLWHAVWND